MTLDETLAALTALPAHAAPDRLKRPLLLAGLNELTRLHRATCEPYRRIVDGFADPSAAPGDGEARTLAEVPYLPVSLFKRRTLASIPAEEITSTLSSSGTSGQTPSRVVIDRRTSSLQQRCLADSMRHVLGPTRLPMLVLDTAAVIRDPKLLSARGAGVLGMMRFGHRPVFLLDESGEPDEAALQGFLERHGGSRFFLFGFTFMVWTELHGRFAARGLDLSNGILVHSGGWKKLVEAAVDNSTFRSRLHDGFGLARVHNFYGMVEQLGSVFVEGDDGLLHPPNFSDVVVRDPASWEPAPDGRPGLVQVLSLIPRSYPGHSLLTEDLGVAHRIGNAHGGETRALEILGRVPRAELRGCSDVIATAAGTAA